MAVTEAVCTGNSVTEVGYHLSLSPFQLFPKEDNYNCMFQCKHGLLLYNLSAYSLYTSVGHVGVGCSPR